MRNTVMRRHVTPSAAISRRPSCRGCATREAIAAAFIGGASAGGRVGTVLGAIIGGLGLGVLNNGMSLVGIGTDHR